MSHKASRTSFRYHRNSIAVPFSVNQLRQLIGSCDTDGVGKLSKSELRAAFNKLGAQIPQFRAYQGMAKADVNGDGFIDLEDNELIKFVLSLGYNLNE